MKSLLKTGAFLAAMLGATAAYASPAIVTTGLNLRTGPGTGYRTIVTMPDGAVVDVRGCVRGYGWCRINWGGYDGWASSGYLAFDSGRYVHRSYSRYGATVGIPLIAGVILGATINHDHDYRHHRDHRHDWRRDDHRDDHRRHDVRRRPPAHHSDRGRPSKDHHGGPRGHDRGHHGDHRRP